MKRGCYEGGAMKGGSMKGGGSVKEVHEKGCLEMVGTVKVGFHEMESVKEGVP